MALRFGGRAKNPTMTSFSCWYGQRRQQGTDIMVCWPYGWTLVRPGSPPWRKQLENWLPGPPVDPTDLMPQCGYMRVPAMCHSPRSGMWASYPREGQRQLPVGKSANWKSTNSFLLAPSHLPYRFEWVQWTHYNLPTRTAGQQHKSYHRQACLPGNWYPTTPGGGAGPKGTTSWWGLHHCDRPVPVSLTPKSEGEGSMTMEVRNLLSQAILETSGCRSKNLTPRRPNPVVVLMPPPQKSKELLQPVDTSSQVSTEMAEASLEGIPTSISPITAASRTQEHNSACRCNGAFGKGQQSPQGAASHQSIHRCPQVESHLGNRYGTLSEWVPSNWIYQRSQKLFAPRQL